MLTDMDQVLGRSRAALPSAVRDMLTEGRTVRSRNRDGEYAIVLTEDRTVVDAKIFDYRKGIADQRADWTIALTGFTFRNVVDAEANGEPELHFFAPVFARDGLRVGTIRVNASPWRTVETDHGRADAFILPLISLRAGDRFVEQEADDHGRAVTFRALYAAEAGRVLAEVLASGEQRVFDLDPDYLASKVVSI